MGAFGKFLMASELPSKKIGRRVGGERREEDARNIAKALRKHGRIALRVHGTSMLPWVRPGDVAMIRRADSAGVRFGDVALFRRANHIYVHRIVKKRGPWHSEKLTVKGDAHSHTDGELEQGELLGRVVHLYRNGARIDLDSPVQLALGLFIARTSENGQFWYPLARLVSFVGRTVRWTFAPFRVSKEIPQ
jgi:peptidase S24-like protein